jgi:hypothetical protein
MTIHNPLYLEKKGYTAREDRLLIGDIFANEGVFSTATDLIPALTTGLGASISAGSCYIQGDTNLNQGKYRFFSDAATPLIFVAPSSLPRIDMVVARVYDSDEVGPGPDSGAIEIVQGTPSSGANLTNLNGAPALTAVPTAMPIAYFHVPTSGSLVGFKELRVGARDGMITTSMLGLGVVTASKIEAQQVWQSIVLAGFTAGIAYYKDSLGMVHFRGDSIPTTGSSAGATLGTLPAGYRPGTTQWFWMHHTASGFESTGRGFTINNAGAIVSPVAIGASTSWAFGGVHFRAES